MSYDLELVPRSGEPMMISEIQLPEKYKLTDASEQLPAFSISLAGEEKSDEYEFVWQPEEGHWWASTLIGETPETMVQFLEIIGAVTTALDAKIVDPQFDDEKQMTFAEYISSYQQMLEDINTYGQDQ